MKKHQRIATWWIRWEDLNWPNHDNLDRIRARAEGFAKANVSAAMFFGTHFRWDFLPVFPLLHDYMATVAEELHRYGILFYDHHSVNLVHRYSTREEMRRVMLDSGPHLPFSPTREAAASWEYRGKRLNDWRMIDVKTRKPAYLPQYTAECFCHRNPEYKEAYIEYIRDLIRETGIDGLSADDGMHYARLNTCGCEHCRAELKRRSGIDLPPIEDTSFWGNWDNPAWLHWLDVRFDSTGEFYRDLGKSLPEGFMLTGCGSNSASNLAVQSASDARHFLRGCNYVNMELNGNTPPYKNDPLTINHSIFFRVYNASHHQAAAREHGVLAFNTGFAHAKVTANHVWALSKFMCADAWIGTLKARLGLPDHILATLPSEEDFVGDAFGFEAQHPELFPDDGFSQVAVYFSNETRNHTFFGAHAEGYSEDYSQTLSLLFRNGVAPHTVFRFPEDPSCYPVILLPSALRMTEEEKAALKRYLAAGGKVVATGPCALEECKHSWNLPNRYQGKPEDMFSSVPDGIHVKLAVFASAVPLPASTDADAWQSPLEGLLYHPHRAVEKTDPEAVLSFCKKHGTPMPLSVESVSGYLVSVAKKNEAVILQLFAEDYDVGINEELDRIRFHRSRVNLIDRVEPIGVERQVVIQSDLTPTVYTPFHREESAVTGEKGRWVITLPEKCSYAIVKFS